MRIVIFGALGVIGKNALARRGRALSTSFIAIALNVPVFLLLLSLVRCLLEETVTDPTLLTSTVAWRDRGESPFGS